MKAIKVTDRVWWVGAVDWGLKEFHGYTTRRGTTYNAYLVLADKITLIDTVKAPFKTEMYSRIRSVTGSIDKIDIVVSNHAEMDHSGALPEVIREAGEKYEPSIVTRHIVDIAQSFNRFYHDEHILVDNEEEKTAKLALVLSAKTAIRNGLALLGMDAPERM